MPTSPPATTGQRTVRALYDAFARGDLAAFLAQLDPGIRWNEAEGFPYSDGNPYVGSEAIDASYRPATRHSSMNTSCTASSASARVGDNRRAIDHTRPP